MSRSKRGRRARRPAVPPSPPPRRPTPPPPPAAAVPPEPSGTVGEIVVPGLVAYAGWVRDALWRVATGAPAERVRRLAELGADVEGEVARINTTALASGHDLGLLADPTRRAMAWLTWLLEPEQREAHLDALVLLAERAAMLDGDARRPAATRGWRIRADLYNIVAIVRGKGRAGELAITIGQPFVGAPVAVLDGLLLAGSGARDRRLVEAAREYALMDDAAEVTMALEVAVAPPPPRSRGEHHDLDASFRRVNALLFDGRLTPPRLAWSRARTRTRLGYYQPLMDMVVVSLSLDDRRVPAVDVDYVMYHELLHRELGRERVGGRHLNHGPAFRAAEQRYPDLAAVARRLGLRGQWGP